MAETGKYDLLLVHARALEEKFVAEGYGTKRYDLMYNDFVILGPANDPAGIRGEKNAATALRKIAQAQSAFVTRGDKSGTHVKELEVWKKAGIEPTGNMVRTSLNRAQRVMLPPWLMRMKSRPTPLWTGQPISQ